MKKRKCDKYGAYIGSFFFGIIGLSNLLGLPQWVKYEGWKEPSIPLGIIFIILSIAIYKYINKVCDEPKIMKCKSCKEVFSELDLEENKCPRCDEELVEINKFYQKSNKNEETNTNPQAD